MFFFFKQKTAYEMRISDWSSDVCSPDLPLRAHLVQLAFELYASGGYSLKTLTNRLNELGLRNRFGRPVSLNGIATVLKNPFYAGIIRTQGQEEQYRSEERRVGKECVRTCRYRGSPVN